MFFSSNPIMAVRKSTSNELSENIEKYSINELFYFLFLIICVFGLLSIVVKIAMDITDEATVGNNVCRLSNTTAAMYTASDHLRIYSDPDISTAYFDYLLRHPETYLFFFFY